MTKDDVAKILDGSEYPLRIPTELTAALKPTDLVIVFGASDDLMEFRGKIYDEIGCYDGGTAYLTKQGLLENRCDCDDCPYFKDEKTGAKTIEALWDIDGVSWSYKTEIPHSTFNILEDGEIYCRGIVFNLSEV